MAYRPSDKYTQMLHAPIPRLVTRLAIPTIISMLVTAFYNMADTFFVGRLGTSATAAVGVVFSMMALIQAFSFFFGHGSGNFISRALGAHDEDSARRMASTGFFCALIAGAVLAVVGILFSRPLARLMGATATILPYAVDYMRIILIGAPWMMASLVLNNQLRFQGSAFYGMIGIASGAILNIALDPLMIFTFRMGIAGAALATIFSQFVSFCLLLYGTRRAGNLTVSIKNFTPNAEYLKGILNGGLPSLCRQGLNSIGTICLNNGAALYGDAAIAAMSIVGRIVLFANSCVIGFGQGFQPVCGFCYGAKRYDRVKRAFSFSVRTVTVFLCCAGVLGFTLAPGLVGLFRKEDADVIAIGAKALRAQCLTFPLSGWIVLCNMMMQTIGKSAKASFLAMARQGLFFVPAILILPRLFGITGLQISQPAADIVTFLVSIPLQLSVFREMDLEVPPQPDISENS
ncbi:MAG: MATE family efflux transporter [Clostridia bacterium]|nr:MATE family efflux transporter [Clostridia bacterium]